MSCSASVTCAVLASILSSVVCMWFFCYLCAQAVGKASTRFSDNQQQDAHEFYNDCVDQVRQVAGATAVQNYLPLVSGFKL
jgi:hypothetical protein